MDISTAHNEARLGGTKTFLDTGGGAGATIEIYDGERPPPGGSVTNLLVTFTLTKPCGTVASNTLPVTAAAIPLAVRDGTATWYRAKTAAGAWAGDGWVSDLAGSGEIKLDTTDILAGGSVRLVSATFR